MAERTFIPGSDACGQWEMLLADALDGQLKPEDDALFTAHKSECPVCAALFEEARRGREWLELLSPEPEVPAGLLSRILSHTGPGHEAVDGFATAGGNVLPVRPVSIPAWQRPGAVARVQRYAEPRLLMTAAMAFFSIALTLNLTGVRLSNLSLAGLRPTAVRSFPSVARSFLERRLTMASTPVIRYYDHSRLVYEVESKVRELRRAAEDQDNHLLKPEDAAPGESRQIPGRKQGGTRVDPPQQSGSPALEPALKDSDDFFETSLTFQGTARAIRRLQKNITGTAVRERSTQWTA
jgi:hypothetical protein